MYKKKNREIIIGSNNAGKIKEIRDLLPKKVQILTPKHFNLKSPKETGSTFKENSMGENLPNHKIGIIHFAGKDNDNIRKNKNFISKIKTLEGEIIEKSLRFEN